MFIFVSFIKYTFYKGLNDNFLFYICMMDFLIFCFKFFLLKCEILYNSFSEGLECEKGYFL